MLNSSILRACALLTTAGVLYGAAVAQAGWFDRAKPKSKVKPAAASKTTRRAQSPDAGVTGSWQQPAAPANGTSWSGGNQSAPTYAYPEGGSCGPCSSHPWCDSMAISHTIRCRKCCDQTYYCPVPPYCYPCYGTNPTCWRRMQECYVCPREELPPPAPKAPRAPPQKVEPPPPAPAVPVQPPEPLDEPGASRARPRASFTAQVSRQQPAVKSASRPRWTGYADTIPEEDELAAPPASPDEEFLEIEDEPEMTLPADDLNLESDEMASEDEADAAAGTDPADELEIGAEIGTDETEAAGQ